MSEKLIKRIGQNSLDDLCEKTIGQLLDDEQSEIIVNSTNCPTSAFASSTVLVIVG